ncbi:Hypothetical predicted protein [Pelobates cultripes]|uniref:Uncharacterized protein n=1 Tax=Pelobates cultripes TaxID=61616 RepID=A0AAD1WEV4_PELCU|nr:Hypothetical predicted protein [Pelobates cultripes]
MAETTCSTSIIDLLSDFESRLKEQFDKFWRQLEDRIPFQTPPCLQGPPHSPRASKLHRLSTIVSEVRAPKWRRRKRRNSPALKAVRRSPEPSNKPRVSWRSLLPVSDQTCRLSPGSQSLKCPYIFMHSDLPTIGIG